MRIVGSEHIRSIDGLRAAAILLVFVSHYGARRFIPGGFGVTLFFFISGFLITQLMIAENQRNSQVAIGAFYARRFLRLAPGLFFMIMIVSVFFFVLNREVNTAQILAAIFYMMNYFEIFGGHLTMPMGPLWSLAVEEHYYLIYPFMFILGWKYRNKFIITLLILCLLVLLWRFALVVEFHAPQVRTYYATDTRIDSILYGALLAALMSQCKPELIDCWLDNIGVLFIATAGLLATFLYRDSVFRETLRYSVQGITLIPLFYAVVFSTRLSVLRKLFELPLLVWIGRLSYSLYLWHIATLYFTIKLLPHFSAIQQYVLAATLAFAMAAFSFYRIEKPFQRLRSRLRKLPEAASTDAQVSSFVRS
jgi:peptidoglycan/LPS O-acetylase OafA/YrhL